MSDIAMVKGPKLSIKQDVQNHMRFCEYLRDNGVCMNGSNRLVKEDGNEWDQGDLIDFVEERLRKDLIIDMDFNVVDVINAIYRDKLLRKKGYRSPIEKYYLSIR